VRLRIFKSPRLVWSLANLSAVSLIVSISSGDPSRWFGGGRSLTVAARGPGSGATGVAIFVGGRFEFLLRRLQPDLLGLQPLLPPPGRLLTLGRRLLRLVIAAQPRNVFQIPDCQHADGQQVVRPTRSQPAVVAGLQILVAVAAQHSIQVAGLLRILFPNACRTAAADSGSRQHGVAELVNVVGPFELAGGVVEHRDHVVELAHVAKAARASHFTSFCRPRGQFQQIPPARTVAVQRLGDGGRCPGAPIV